MAIHGMNHFNEVDLDFAPGETPPPGT